MGRTITTPHSHVQTRSPINPAVQLAAAAVLLHEGVEGSDQLGHGARMLTPGCAGRQ